jgi:predicted RecB family nuclease
VRVDDRCGLIVSPSDLTAFLACSHLTSLETTVARGDLSRLDLYDPQAELIRRKGEEHERAYLAELRARGLRIVEFELGDELDWERAAAQTAEALAAGVDVVYQGVFVHDGWRGIADFLERQPDGSYEAADTKLARTSKPAHILQLCFYTEQLARATGREPAFMHVLLGSGLRDSYRPGDFLAYYRRVRQRFLEFVADPPATYPLPVSHCSICDFRERCRAQWERDDHLTLVARLRRDQVPRFTEAGIATLAELAAAPPDTEVRRMTASTFEGLRDQAALQYGARMTGRHAYHLLEPAPKRGFELLPKPSPGDVFFDIEADPFWAADRGLEYLFGVLWREDGGTAFRGFWGHDREGEKRAFEELVDFLHERLRADPDTHVYHYAAYEPVVLKRLMGLYGTREEEVDDLLRRGVLVDLFAVVRHALRASCPSYSLKDIERFYLDGRQAEVKGGADSVLLYEQWRDTGAEELLEAIRAYNEEDCLSTLLLRDWLLERRAEAESQYGRELAWAVPDEPREVSEEAAEAYAERERLRAELLDDLPDDPSALTEEQRPRYLAAQLLEYHRREAKPVWWAFFDRLGRSPAELVDDSEAIGELEPDGSEPVKRARSLVHGFTYPVQEHKLDPGDEVFDPATGVKAGWILELDDADSRLALVRGPMLEEVPLPRALIPGGPFDTKPQREALARLATSLLEGSHRHPVLEGILARERPRAGCDVVQTTDLEEMKQLVADLDASHLVVQGPPGSGKTWTGARLIVQLLRDGKRVGVTATSHKAIHNLLFEVERVAAAEGVDFKGLKKSTSGAESVFSGARIQSSGEVEAFVDPEVRLLAGTAWLFARSELDGAVDYLFVDEAGQVSLADALAVGTSARNVVLLGDPVQLAQVTQGTHPPGSGASVLEHLLGDAHTIPPDRGLFLERTFRLHPDVAAFVSEAFYEGRLRAAEGCERQGTAFGTGLRFLPVEHEGSRRSSVEEAERVRAAIEEMLGGDYTDAKGKTRPLRESDFMVVAPYNAQVHCLHEALPEGVPVGTVDKFQGQEAPVVFFSMASSSGEDIPRNIEFLFSHNRLNVAVSRARCLAILVASPKLLDIRCRTVEQMRLANALCRFVEGALPVTRSSERNA